MIADLVLPELKVKDSLTYEERRLVTLVAAGYTDREIARRFGIADQTVRNRVARLRGVCHVANRAELVALAARNGWIDLEAVYREMAPRRLARARAAATLY